MLIRTQISHIEISQIFFTFIPVTWADHKATSFYFLNIKHTSNWKMLLFSFIEKAELKLFSRLILETKMIGKLLMKINNYSIKSWSRRKLSVTAFYISSSTVITPTFVVTWKFCWGINTFAEKQCGQLTRMTNVSL